MVTYRVAPGYDCSAFDFARVVQKLETLRTSAEFECPLSLQDQGKEVLRDMVRDVVAGWQNGSDQLAVVVYHDCIRFNCSGGGFARTAKELHRKAVIIELLKFAMNLRINLDVTSA